MGVKYRTGIKNIVIFAFFGQKSRLISKKCEIHAHYSLVTIYTVSQTTLPSYLTFPILGLIQLEIASFDPRPRNIIL